MYQTKDRSPGRIRKNQATDLKRHFRKEPTGIADEHRNKCSAGLVIRQVQVKAITRSLPTPTRTTQVRTAAPARPTLWGNRNSHTWPVGGYNSEATWGKRLGKSLIKLNTRPPSGPTIALLGIYPREMQACVVKNLIQEAQAASSLRAPNGNGRGPTNRKWLRNHRTGMHAADATQRLWGSLRGPATTWLDLKDIQTGKIHLAWKNSEVGASKDGEGPWEGDAGVPDSDWSFDTQSAHMCRFREWQP